MQLVYITTSDIDEARKVGRGLVEKRLAACVNILGDMTSIYWWKGKIEEGREAVLIAKTDETRVDALIDEVKRLHSYDVPCAIILPIKGGNPDYLKWLSDSLSAE